MQKTPLPSQVRCGKHKAYGPLLRSCTHRPATAGTRHADVYFGALGSAKSRPCAVLLSSSVRIGSRSPVPGCPSGGFLNSSRSLVDIRRDSSPTSCGSARKATLMAALQPYLGSEPRERRAALMVV